MNLFVFLPKHPGSEDGFFFFVRLVNSSTAHGSERGADFVDSSHGKRKHRVANRNGRKKKKGTVLFSGFGRYVARILYDLDGLVVSILQNDGKNTYETSIVLIQCLPVENIIGHQKVYFTNEEKLYDLACRHVLY